MRIKFRSLGQRGYVGKPTVKLISERSVVVKYVMGQEPQWGRSVKRNSRYSM